MEENQSNNQNNNQFNRQPNNQFNNQNNSQFNGQNNNQFNNQYSNNFNTQAIRNETTETIQQVRESIKNVDFKNDTREATGFVKGMFKNPFEKIKEIAEDKNNKYLKIAIIFIIIWVVSAFIKALALKHWSFNAIFRNVLSLVKTVVAPVLSVLILSAIVYFVNKKEKKSLTTIVTAITIAKIPKILGVIISLLTVFSLEAYTITSPITSLCSVITIVLTYFTIKQIMNEENNAKFFKTFVIIEAIYYFAYFLMSFLEIYI